MPIQIKQKATDGKKVVKPAGESAAIIAALIKKRGPSVVLRGSDVPLVKRLPTGMFEVDLALGGGYPKARMSMVYGPEGCLDEDTFIRYEVRDEYGNRQNHKGGSIKRLWHRFHGKTMPGSGAYQRTATLMSDFYAPCVNEEGRIFQNRIIDVVDSGVKECFRIDTESGMSIVATAEHKFFVGHGFVPVSGLSIGSTVMVHKNVPFTTERKNPWRPEVLVKHHPFASVKVIEGKYVYRRLSVARAQLEATNNRMTYPDYLGRLNSGDLTGLVFLPPGVHVHHRDENFTNNDPDNLVALVGSEHNRAHALKDHNNLRYMVVEETITSITPVGTRRTYDLRMESPHNNYVANGFAVHNSGKSNHCACLAATTQKNEPVECNKVVWVDLEGTMDPTWMVKFGVDMDELIVVKPSFGEEAADMIDALVRASDVALIIVDSIAVLSSAKEGGTGEGQGQSLEAFDVGSAALLTKRLVNKICWAFAAENAREHQPAVVFINQTRFKIGVTRGDPETVPGGKAMLFNISLNVRLSSWAKVEKALHPTMPVFRQTTMRVKKSKVPVRQIESTYDMCVHDLDKGGVTLRVGQTDSWTLVKGRLQINGDLVSAKPKGWKLFGQSYDTQEPFRVLYYNDAKFRQKCQNAVLEKVTDVIMTVEASGAAATKSDIQKTSWLTGGKLDAETGTESEPEEGED